MRGKEEDLGPQPKHTAQQVSPSYGGCVAYTCSHSDAVTLNQWLVCRGVTSALLSPAIVVVTEHQSGGIPHTQRKGIETSLTRGSVALMRGTT